MLGVCGLLFLLDIWALPLVDPDETRYALVVRHMLRTGDWLVPHVAGRVYRNKPMPYFWLAAAGRVLTGDVEMGGRLVSALSGVLAVFVTFALARSVAGNRAGLIAGIILATSPGPLVLARVYRMDMPFVALMWAALWWFWRYERSGKLSPGELRKRWLGFYAFCAAATLMKGPAGLVLPGLVVGAYLLLSGRPRRILEPFRASGLALYLLLAAPWYVAISIRHPQYLHEFLFVQNFVRYAGKAMEGKTFPGIYYVGIVLGCLLPWTVYLPGAILRGLPRSWRNRTGKRVMLFGWLAVLVPLVFFMIGRTRLALYVLPVAPPLAAMVAIPMARWVRSRRPDRVYRIGTIAMRVAVVAMLLALAGFECHTGWLDPWIALPAALVAVASVFMARAVRRQRRGAYLAWAPAGTIVTLIFAICHTAPRVCAARSMASLGRTARAQGGGHAYLCYFGQRRYSFALYAGQTDARRFRSRVEYHRRELVKLLRSDRPVYCLVEGEAAMARIEADLGDRLVVLQSNGKFFLCTNNQSEATGPPM